MITVKPFGGLGNRIRVLYSVLGINQELNHQIKILWDCNQELNCPFEELFVTPENCRISNIEQGLYRKGHKFIFDKLHFSKLRKYTYDLALTDKTIARIRRENEDSHEHRIFYKHFQHSSIYIETCRHFFDGPKVTDFLTIQPEIEKEAQKIYDTFGPSVYGIHIRRTDNLMSKKYSPPSAFRQLIQKKLEEEHDAQFFLATDSKEIEKEFLYEFGQCIITNSNKELNRNSKQGIKDALIAMICLSKTNKIYGSFYSSFTWVSALLSGIDYENVIADNVDPYNQD